ncbi:hypothetical protein ABZX85_10500 [Streptomyces sp. NPDC004539]|uniref:hypothetical protein n=1 Tax=Streptomyces sp. NPDC004539 TaxID=3154280 RepID=UPI0033BCFDDD
MNSVLHSRIARALAAGAMSVALAAGGAAASYAAATPKPKPSASPMSDASITVKADKSSVKQGDEVTFTGRTKGLKVGAKLTLQHEKDGKWTTLKASTTVKNGSSYSLKGKLNTKGAEKLRIASGKVYSPTVTVKVN